MKINYTSGIPQIRHMIWHNYLKVRFKNFYFSPIRGPFMTPYGIILMLHISNCPMMPSSYQDVPSCGRVRNTQKIIYNYICVTSMFHVQPIVSWTWLPSNSVLYVWCLCYVDILQKLGCAQWLLSQSSVWEVDNVEVAIWTSIIDVRTVDINKWEHAWSSGKVCQDSWSLDHQCCKFEPRFSQHVCVFGQDA